MPAADTEEDQLAALMASYRHDPFGWVMAAFPWGEPGPLEHEAGPRPWQRDALDYVGRRLAAGSEAADAMREVVQMAVASGHGIGKSALVSWLVLWAMSTCANTRGVVTANTENQLRTKTWPEITKWHGMMLNSHWFECAATSLHAVGDLAKTWRIDAIPWSEHNTEAFAGLHAKGARILVVFDEASAIHDKIWEVTEGALTDTGTDIIWATFGNPTKNAGRFRSCFGSLAHRWHHLQIDSRTVPGTNTDQIAKWVQDYGEDSDFVRVRVKGQFPRAGSMQFIASDVVEAAATREPNPTLQDPLILGVDVARFGDDESAIFRRRGLDARTWRPEYHRGLDTMALAGRVAQIIAEERPDAVFVDETGVGAGVVDRLRQLGHHVIGINNGAKPDRPRVGDMAVANKGAECWAAMREWLRTGAIPNDPDLRAQLESREYGYNVHNAVVLERKDDMKKRGLASPDRADGLALTFAHPVAPVSLMGSGSSYVQGRSADYDPLR